MTNVRARRVEVIALSPSARSPLAMTARLGMVATTALLVANCGSQTRSGGVDPKYGVAPSPLVVAEGDPVPKGGGREQVGKPYTVAGKTYVPREQVNYRREGVASWYGQGFHGRLTANGEVFDRFSVSAAHTTMPLPSYARVTNMQNGRSMIVRVNDRGPYHGNRIIDVSQRVAEALDFRRAGMAQVRVEYAGRASLRGSDDRLLMATLRTDGQPATIPGITTPVMLASADPLAAAGPFAARAASEVPAPASPRTTVVAAAPPVAAPAPAVVQPSTLRVAANVPLPPERPFDLGAARRNAGPGVTADRRKLAALFFDDPDTQLQSFTKSGPFAAASFQRSLSFKE